MANFYIEIKRQQSSTVGRTMKQYLSITQSLTLKLYIRINHDKKLEQIKRLIGRGPV